MESNALTNPNHSFKKHLIAEKFKFHFGLQQKSSTHQRGEIKEEDVTNNEGGRFWIFEKRTSFGQCHWVFLKCYGLNLHKHAIMIVYFCFITLLLILVVIWSNDNTCRRQLCLLPMGWHQIFSNWYNFCCHFLIKSDFIHYIVHCPNET